MKSLLEEHRWERFIIYPLPSFCRHLSCKRRFMRIASAVLRYWSLACRECRISCLTGRG